MLNGEGHDASATEGEHSQYDVVADGTLVFSKQREGRYPTAGEIEQALP